MLDTRGTKCLVDLLQTENRSHLFKVNFGLKMLLEVTYIEHYDQVNGFLWVCTLLCRLRIHTEEKDLVQ